jgi:hypothetical protein
MFLAMIFQQIAAFGHRNALSAPPDVPNGEI